MHWIEIKVAFDSHNEALTVDLIADIFNGLGAKGVVVDDPHLDPPEGWGDDALSQPTQPAVTGYLPVDDQLEQQHKRLDQALADLAGRHELTYAVSSRSIDEEDWAESWKAHFWPQTITPRLVVKPTWREYTPEPGQQVIEIDPGMAFGTGTHPTTTLCVQLLEHHIRPGLSILDVGTGSGILLIAAAKLGAARLTGVDLDPAAVEIARKNLKRNHIAPQNITLYSGNLIDPLNQTDEAFDLVVANILAEVVIELLDKVGRVLKPGGILICSGIIEAFQSGVSEKMTACGFDDIETRKQADWVALAGRMKNVQE